MIHSFVTPSGKKLSFDNQTGKIELKENAEYRDNLPIVINGNFSFYTERISKFILEITQNCNLRCSYCVFSGKYDGFRTHAKRKLSKQTLDLVSEFIKAHADRDAPEISICFFGGEALLEWKAVQYAISLFDNILGDRVRYSISTNGLLLKPSIIEYICQHDNISVYITIDGNQTEHDARRVDMNGKGSFDIIMKNLRFFKTVFPKEYSEQVKFLTTVYSWDEVNRLDKVWKTNDLLIDSPPVHISQIMPNFSDKSRNYDSIDIKRMFYHDAFVQLKNGESNIMTKEFLYLMDIIENRRIGETLSILNISSCYNNLFSCFINAYGDLYPCERFCTHYSIGSVTKGFDQGKMRELQERFVSILNRYCAHCWAYGLCQMCLTGLNHTDEDFPRLCDMERDSMDVALGLYCDYVDWKNQTGQKEDDSIIDS